MLPALPHLKYLNIAHNRINSDNVNDLMENIVARAALEKAGNYFEQRITADDESLSDFCGTKD